MKEKDVKKPKIVKTECRRKNKSDLGDNFVAPDGGYGWIIVIACGLSNLTLFPALQTFGLLYRERLLGLGLTNSEITTIINTQQAISSCTGLLNGPLFRRFTYRQVAFAGAFLLSFGLFLSSFASNFYMFIISFSCLYGFGMGINISSSTLVINTYFKVKRRRVHSFAWTITGLGPIFMPYVANFLLSMYGYQGAVWFFCGLSLQTFVCAMLYHPVQWHPKKIEQEINVENTIVEKNNDLIETEVLVENDDRCTYCKRLGKTILSSTNSLNVENSVYDFEPPRSCSIGSKRFIISGKENNLDSKFVEMNSNADNKTNNSKSKSSASLNQCNECSCAEKKLIPSSEKTENDTASTENIQLKWYQKIALFFELDLLKDPIYIILMLGITFAIFADMNFSVLTPFILKDFQFNNSEIALIMSLAGAIDVVVRFLLPFCIEKIRWSNQIFFIIAILILVSGRFLISLSPSFYVALILFSIVGIGKGIRTIFMGLIIPDYVPLKRLPAATGLQLLTAGIFTIACGPIVGAIRDATNFSITINFLNLISLVTAVTWTIQIVYQKLRNKS